MPGMAVNCLIAPRRLRAAVSLFGFSAVFLWVVFASYADEENWSEPVSAQPRGWDGETPGVHARRLLAASSLRADTSGSGGGALTYDPSTVDVSAAPCMHGVLLRF